MEVFGLFPTGNYLKGRAEKKPPMPEVFIYQKLISLSINIMLQLSIKMLPESSCNQYAYNYADLLVQVKLGREFKLKADYSFMVYSESLRLMAGESTWDGWHQAWRAGRTFSMTMRGNTLWMPGKYFFLMASRDGRYAIRFDLVLDDKCSFTVGAPRCCKSLSDEDILAHQVFEAANSGMLCVILRE